MPKEALSYPPPARVNGANLDATLVRVGDRQLTVRELLWSGPASGKDASDSSDPTGELGRAREVFVRSGLAALEAVASVAWVQFGLTPMPRADVRGRLYRKIAELARQLLEAGDVTDFFFMHKPPGLRLRFRVGERAPGQIAGQLRRFITAWHREGLVERFVPGVYEPESRLFGGPISMRYVHRLFTADSLAWLDWHGRTPSGAAAGGSGWPLSLAMLRALFDALDVAGWEHVDVWYRVREQTGRRLDGEARELAGFASVAAEITACWRDRDQLREQLGSGEREIADEFRDAVVPIASDWLHGYFATDVAYVGPRQCAAFSTVFHWNRARLPMMRQAILTEALAAEVDQ